MINILKRIILSNLSTAFLMFLIASVSVAAQTPPYLITEVGDVTPASVNDNGVVAGSSSYQDGRNNYLRAAIWRGGVKRDLGTLGGLRSMSRAINVVSNQFVITSEDHVVGWAEDSSGNRQAFLWTPTNGMMNLNDVKVGPDNLSAREQGWNLRGAFGVNRKGQIVGRGSHTQDSAEGCTPDGFIWELGADGNAVVRRIGLGDRCDGDNETRGINEFGDVAGILPNPARPNRKAAVKMFDLDYVIDLGSLGGQLGMSYSINNKREVVGHASDSNNLSKAFYWNPEMATTGMVSLGTLGGTGSGARGISDSSQVVGWAYDAKVKGRACLWDLGSKQTYDLNVLSNAGSQWFLEDAQSISSNGRYIIGNSIIKGKRKTYLLTRQF